MFYFVCMSALPACVHCTISVPSAHGDQKGTLDPLELYLTNPTRCILKNQQFKLRNIIIVIEKLVEEL